MADEQVTTPDEGVKPAEQPTAQETPSTETQTETQTDEAREKAEQEATEQKPWYKKRFDELTRKRYEEAHRAEEAIKRAEQLEARIKSLEESKNKTETKPPVTGRPTLEQFEYDQEKYFDALTDWKLGQREMAAAEERKRMDAENAANRERMTFEQKRAELVASGKQKFNDWENIVYSIPAAIMHKNLADAVLELPSGSEVAYYLGKNIQEAERVSKLSPYAMAAELGKIEAKLSTNDKKSTNAPPPPNPIGGGTSSGAVIDPEKNPKEWMAARNAGKI